MKKDGFERLVFAQVSPDRCQACGTSVSHPTGGRRGNRGRPHRAPFPDESFRWKKTEHPCRAIAGSRRYFKADVSVFRRHTSRGKPWFFPGIEIRPLVACGGRYRSSASGTMHSGPVDGRMASLRPAWPAGDSRIGSIWQRAFRGLATDQDLSLVGTCLRWLPGTGLFFSGGWWLAGPALVILSFVDGEW